MICLQRRIMLPADDPSVYPEAVAAHVVDAQQAGWSIRTVRLIDASRVMSVAKWSNGQKCERLSFSLSNQAEDMTMEREPCRL